MDALEQALLKILGYLHGYLWTIRLLLVQKRSLLGQSIQLSFQVQNELLYNSKLLDVGTLYVCGLGDSGQLGTGKRDKELVPVHMSLISEKVRDVACGTFHTLILTGIVYMH